MKIAICGSRELNIFEEDLLAIVNWINTFYNAQVDTWEIVSGGAKGIDLCAKNLAEKYNFTVKEFLPEYDKFEGRLAPLKRNEQIADYADVLLVIHNGSNGSAHVKKEFKKRKKHVFDFEVPKLKQEI